MGYAKPYPKPEKVKKDLNEFAKALSKFAKRKFIKKISDKMAERLKEYTKLKKEFIKGKVCPIYPHLKVVDIHHKLGRNGVLLNDTRYWLAVSRKGHMKIELNPKWAKEQGYSLSRR
jgi:hypothetical protein